ncbi:sigma-70 family RNA polymerase sigma factor [Cryobacterium suzukii]|uniref:RNA polymerase sigma factor n=1 Tax=Cryobacterium suzukii TaxID=1259198 RepID=A0A4R9AJA2_9MICO|nr:sigma-70 family RNA polymerase sigma factor [Cryobacterium suzukii]TFD62732.1 sigma-70 family RNA polymerase sigma factor [Cryobacterium suzukii]
MADERAELLQALHDEHGPILWRYVVRLTHDTAFADDVVQETLLRAWRRPRLLDQTEVSARAWLFTVARNLVIDDRRSARARHEVSTDQLPEVPTDDQTDALLDAWLVADALNDLSSDHRAVIVCAYYRGQSVAETARELVVPEGTVKSRLHYGLRALRLALQERGVTER